MSSLLHNALFQSIHQQLSSYSNDWFHLTASGNRGAGQQIQDIQASIKHYFQHYKLQTCFLDNQQRCLYAATPPGQQTLLIYTIVSTQSVDLAPLFASLAAYTHIQYLRASGSASQSPPLALKWFTEIVQPAGGMSLASATEDTSCVLSGLRRELLPLLTADACLLITPYSELTALTSQTTGASAQAGPDTYAQLILGSCGWLQVELTAHTTDRRLPAYYGTVVPDAAWQLLWTLQGIKGAREDIQLEHFYDQLVTPEDEVLASLKVLAERFHFSNKYCGVEQFLAELQGLQLLYAYFLTPSCNVTLLESPGDNGDKSTENEQALLSGTAHAILNFLLLPEQDPQPIFHELQQHIVEHGSKGITARLITAQRPERSKLTDGIVQAAHTALQSAYQRNPILIPAGKHIPAFTYARQRLQIPVAALVLPDHKQLYEQRDNPAQLEPLLRTFALLFTEYAESFNATS